MFGGCRHGADAAGDAGGASEMDATIDGGEAPPFATIIRLINDLGVEYRLNHHPSFACPYGFTIRGGPLDQPTSLEGADTLCPCETCREGAARSPVCTTVDLSCDALPAVGIPPGGSYDLAWSGVVTLWRQDVPACRQSCSQDYPVPRGEYRFTLTEFSGLESGRHWDADAPLPARGGVVAVHLR